MAGFIQCNYGGGGSAVEVITGTMEGAAGDTSAGQITVSSQQGKAPKRALFRNKTKWISGGMSELVWASDEPTKSVSVYYSGSSASANIRANGSTSSSYPVVMSVGADNITLACPTTANLYAGTWEYSVEFE